MEKKNKKEDNTYRRLFEILDSELPDSLNIFGMDAYHLRRNAVKRFIMKYTTPKVGKINNI